MSVWEIYTWFSVTVLIIGPLIIVGCSFRDLRGMWRSVRERQGDEKTTDRQ